jgi:hypothetical protein
VRSEVEAKAAAGLVETEAKPKREPAKKAAKATEAKADVTQAPAEAAEAPAAAAAPAEESTDASTDTQG